MKVTMRLLANLWDVLDQAGATRVGLVFQRGGFEEWEAVLTFRWRGERYERAAVADHTGMAALEQLTHVVRCIFEPKHEETFARILRERPEPRRASA